MTSAPAARAVGFEPTAQDRTVDVSITVTPLQGFPPPTGCIANGPPTHHADAESAADFSAFAATANVASFVGISASQSSSLGASAIEAQGSGRHEGSGGFVS